MRTVWYVNFGWIIINETLLDVSPKGAFDLIEHGHYIRGPNAVGPAAEVTMVFTPDVVSWGPFGRGTELPDIDERDFQITNSGDG